MDLKELRKLAGLTQWELAQRSGVSRMRLSLAECRQVELRGEEEGAVRGVLAVAMAAREARAVELRSALSGSNQAVAV